MFQVSEEYIKEVHRYAIKHGSNIDEMSLLDTTRYDADLYFLVIRLNNTEDPYKRAAEALYTIANRHPFVEGNKRTALLLCENLLDNNIFICAPEEEINTFVRKVASCESDISEDYIINKIVKWLKNNTRSLTE